MSFESDLQCIYNKYNKQCVSCVKPGNVTVYVFLTKPDSMSLNQDISSASVVINGITSELSDLKKGMDVTVDEIPYVVKFGEAVSDGSITDVYLSKKRA